ncbi:hypothetical protein GW17_00037506 [Ensete ventricosum]|nr:hypothetical protein GW17_00037506 [Ensete ventricosum]
MPVSAAPIGASHARGQPRLLVTAPCEMATLARGFGHGRPPLEVAWTWLATPAGGLVVASHPFPHYLDGEDEGGQVSFSLAVSIRWISTAKFLQSDLATLAQREGGE